MVSKTPKLEKGVTVIELLIVVSIIGFLAASILLLINVSGVTAKARDEKRLSDLVLMENAVNYFYKDTGRYPNYEELLTYIKREPLDPLNRGDYVYTYYTQGTSYEINAKLEFLIDLMANDGGNATGLYEVGNNLEII
jgi:prepilin-type N-terminal cleavage/methylation domain-containing protein